MIARVPAPDGQKGKDGHPITVLPEGTLLKDRYRVSYYSVGGMSIVYRGECEGTAFLLKEVMASDSQRVISLTQEKSMLERLDHPGIVRVCDFFEEQGFYYMVLPFITGRSLDRLVAKTPGVFLDEDQVTSWAFQLYDIFEYLHGLTPPVIYRDLKPQNVILDTSDRLKLVDFGIARVFKGGKEYDTFSMGSAITASPEHYGGRQTDARSDIFTIGATLHYLLCNGKGAAAGLFNFVPIRILNPAYSRGLERLLKKSLDVEPENRFQRVSEMRKAHLAVLEARQRGEEEETPEKAPPLEPAMAMSQQGQAPPPTMSQGAWFVFIGCILLCAGVLLGLKLSKTSGAAHSLARATRQPSTGQAAAVAPSLTPRASITALQVLPSGTASSSSWEPVTSSDMDARGGRWFRDDAAMVRFIIPEGFTAVETAMPGIFQFIKSDGNAGGVDSTRYLQVRVSPRQGGFRLSIPDYVSHIRAMGAQNITENPQGDRVMELRYLKPDNHGLFHQVREFVIEGNEGQNTYVVTVAARPELFNRFVPEFNTFTSSFHHGG